MRPPSNISAKSSLICGGIGTSTPGAPWLLLRKPLETLKTDREFHTPA
jgi:hypothetical protein